MINKTLRSILYLMIFSLSLLTCNNTDKKTTIEIEKGLVGMIGFGSLMSLQSMELTLQRKYDDSIYLVHLQGFQREWNWHLSFKDPRLSEKYLNKDWFYLRDNDTISVDNVIALNIVGSEKNQMNCVLYFITPDELTGFDEREIGYERIDVTDKIKEYYFKGGKVYAYKAKSEQVYRPEMNKNNSIIQQSYFDLVINACDSIGKNFRKEYDESTKSINPDMIAPVIGKKVK